MTISGTKMCSKPIKERERNASDRAILAARKEAFLDAANIAESMTLYTGYDVAQRLRKLCGEICDSAPNIETAHPCNIPINANIVVPVAVMTAALVGRILKKSLGDDPRKNEIMRHLLSAQDKYLKDMTKKDQP